MRLPAARGGILFIYSQNMEVYINEIVWYVYTAFHNFLSSLFSEITCFLKAYYYFCETYYLDILFL